MDLLNVHSSDPIKDNREESNAFQILMSHNNWSEHSTFTNTTKLEECGEELHSKGKSINNKKCFKRKISEVESEKGEKIVQNSIKLFKPEEKQDNFMDATVLCPKQPSGSLLDYFSKTSVNLQHTNVADISTILVKADVHMSQDAIKYDLYNSVSNSTVEPNKRNKTSELQFSQVNDVNVVKSQNNEKKQKWSLRIKFETYEDEDISLDDISDEKLYSPRSQTKLNMENSKKSKINKSAYSANLKLKNVSNKELLKKSNKHMKSKLKKCGEPVNSECTITTQNSKYQKPRSVNTHKVTKLDKCKSASVQTKILSDCINIDLKTDENKVDQENSIISNEDTSKQKVHNKLAPLFTKQQKLNSKEILTKQLFLQTNTKDNSDKNINQQIYVFSTLPFPLISHVTQLTTSSCKKINNFNFPQRICNQLYKASALNVKHYKHVIDLSESKLKTLKNINKPNINEVLTEIEKNYSDVKKMWDIISLTAKHQSYESASTKPKIKNSKQLKNTGVTEYKDIENQIENFIWTYKYRPKSSQEIVGNEKAAMKLKEWLVTWKITFIDEDNSEDEFYSFDGYSKKNKNNQQVAVLLGPHGSGKTASVYAVAEEFGYTVLELNASSRRTGKKILKELEEATKSHRIKEREKISVFCSLTSDGNISKKVSQKSLILIEDIDIVFDEDEGFISAVYQLVSNTKRPIIMTCKDVCSYLHKLAPNQNRIYFQSVVGNKVSTLLELISLAETGYKLSSDYATELLQNGDLRKAILQLQYLLLSGPPQISERLVNFKNLFRQNMQYHLYRPAIIVSKKQKRKKTTSNKSINNINLFHDITNKLENIAILTSLIDIEDSTSNLWQLKTQPSLSLIENTELYSVCNDICLDIAEWIGNKVMYKDHNYNGIQCQNNVMLRKQVNEEVNLALSHTTSLLLDRRIIATDYLPHIRTICRAEEHRAIRNNKRGNRYFHYLHNLKPPSILKPNILMAACKIMHDKTDTDMCTSK